MTLRRPVDLSHYAWAQRSLHAEQEIDLWVRVSRCLYDFIEQHAQRHLPKHNDFGQPGI